MTMVRTLTQRSRLTVVLGGLWLALATAASAQVERAEVRIDGMT